MSLVSAVDETNDMGWQFIVTVVCQHRIVFFLTLCFQAYLYASSKTFLMALHLADSVKPTMSSGEQIFTKGKPDCRADINAHNVIEIGNKDHHQESIDQIGELRRKMKKVPLLILPLP